MQSWAVVLKNDDINTHAGVTYVLNRVLALPPGGAYQAADDVHRKGSVELAAYRTEAEAQALVLELQAYGLNAIVQEV